MDAIPEDWSTAVCVVAHPDDLEYGPAAAVARWTDQGKEVAYVLATSGEAGIDGLAPADCQPLREEEERRSAALVGVRHVEFLGHPDGMVEPGLALRRDIAGAIRRLRPDVVVTMNFDLTWGDGEAVNHADHRVVGRAVLDAARDAANRWVFPEVGERRAGLEHVYVSGTVDATHYVDVGETFERGIASLREHRAYLDGLGQEFDPDAFYREITGSLGAATGCQHAIGFRRYAVG